MTARRFAAIAVAAAVIYMVFLGWRGLLLLGSGSVGGVLLGLAVLVLPALGVYLVWKEVSFGIRVEALAKRLEAAGELPADDLPRRPSGRIEREAADERFATASDDLDSLPNDPGAWFRVAVAYDDAGDRRRARAAMRRAIALESGRGPAGPAN